MRHNGNGERRPEEIQAEIARTRAEMDGTLSAIEHRLTPGQLVDQGLDYMRNSGANEFVSNLGGSVKQNPLPVALVGVGLAWLMALGRNPAQHESSVSSSRLVERARGAMDSLRSSTHSTAGSAHSAMDTLSSGAQSAREQASHLGDAATHRLSRARDQARSGFDSMLREQPLVLGAIGLAIGAVLAAAAPRTRQEDELMGEARDRLAERATEAGKEQMEKAKQVAGSAMDAATEAVKKETGEAPPQANTGGPHGTRRVP